MPNLPDPSLPDYQGALSRYIAVCLAESNEWLDIAAEEDNEILLELALDHAQQAADAQARLDVFLAAEAHIEAELAKRDLTEGGPQ